MLWVAIHGELTVVGLNIFIYSQLGKDILLFSIVPFYYIQHLNQVLKEVLAEKIQIPEFNFLLLCLMGNNIVGALCMSTH